MTRVRHRRPAWIATGAAFALAALAATTFQAHAAAQDSITQVAVTGDVAPAPLAVHYNWPAGFTPNILRPDVPPPGAIGPDAAGRLAGCTRPGRLPVVLVHGTFENQHDNWAAAAPLLFNAGFCVYSFTYGGEPGAPFAGTGPIPASAAQLATFIDRVRAVTRSNQVDVLGHSQGGMMPRYYLKFIPAAWTGGAFGAGVPKIRRLVALSPSNHGTTLSGLTTLGRLLGALGTANTLLQLGRQQAAVDQEVGSRFNAKLDTCPGGLPSADVCAGDQVDYTVIETRDDQVVTPFRNAFLAANPDAPARVVNLLVQDTCPIDASEHLAITYDSFVYGKVLRALGIADPAAVPGASPACKLVLPLIGR